MPDNDTQDAPQFTQQVADKAKEQTQQIKDTAQQAVQQGKQGVAQLWDVGRSQFHNVLTGQKDRAAAALGDVGQVLHSSADQLREQGQAGAGQLAGSLADKVTGVSESVQGKEIEEILADTEEFARRQLAVFLTVAALLGFVLARFLKSSGEAVSAA